MNLITSLLLLFLVLLDLLCKIFINAEYFVNYIPAIKLCRTVKPSKI
jgi:hypothetical protein